MAFLNEYGVAQLWAAMKDRLSGAFNSVDFDVAEAAANLVSGDSIPTAFGKLAKNYSSILTSISDLNTDLTSKINTKLNKSDVLANYTTLATGKALDASLGPAIKSKMDLVDTLAEKFVIDKHSSLSGYTNYTDNVRISNIPANSTKWVSFPVTKTNYIPAGILGYYIQADRGGSQATMYSLLVTNSGVSVAFYTGSDGIENLLMTFIVLWQRR
jgi:hypothetical protein